MTMCFRYRLAASLLLGLFATDPSHGIVVRGDAPRGDILADPSDYPGVAALLGGRAVGTLIADDWMLLTAGTSESFNTMTASWGSRSAAAWCVAVPANDGPMMPKTIASSIKMTIALLKFLILSFLSVYLARQNDLRDT